MKQALVIFSIIVISSALNAQDDERELIDRYCNLLVNDLVESTKGCLKNDTWENLEEGGVVKNTLIGLPDSYNFDLARMDVRRLVKKYPDINISTLWQQGYDSFYHVVLELPGNLAGIIYYSKKVNTIRVTVGKK
ncbi:MAG TPA: hypothetical protein ENH59_00865 [Bacteroidetes bacterium]|nr:hypothetical protein [Bacteroidota bacterium]